MNTAMRSAALLLTLGVGLFAMAGPASAATSVTDISDGTLLAEGVAVEVSFSFTCDKGRNVTSNLMISQRVNAGRIARGFGSNTGGFEPCTGDLQTETVTVIAESSAFKNGTALAIVDLLLCDPGFPGFPGVPDFSSCTNFRSIEEIQLDQVRDA
ncbi:hypothetical protein [Arthrobacter cavernae]|uniref:Uncharacterized protein n=1 Tax=Arthrobacter cavernae TaxID=2817681 RepID=A0A939HH52_9MICC|nr:hypothetical protein [Arthrobacter cavernae]MBO1267892.1 hypothetical protein [Arthrobacter cavernae]